jgi:CO/xanthine dehydrogenase Mo-binding subunit
MAFANETHMQDIADRLQLDSLELRRLNLMRDGSYGPSGQVISDPAIRRCVDEVADLLEQWRRADQRQPAEEPWRRGYGLACTWWLTSPLGSSASVRMNEDGTATVFAGAPEIGTGAVVDGLRELAATDLGLAPERVTLVTSDTEIGPQDPGSDGSRTLYGAGNAVLGATVEIRRILAESLAEEFEADPRDIVFARGQAFVAGSPSASMPLSAAVALTMERTGPVVATGRFQPPSLSYAETCVQNLLLPTFTEPTFHCHGVTLDVDRELGTVRVRRYAAAHDVGRVINWTGVKGQIEGGVVQGIGYALWEEILTDGRGHTQNADLVDYRLPTAADVPDELIPIPIEGHLSLHGPRGLKGVGEAPVILPAAALGAAIRNALGLRITELPLTAPRIAAAAARAAVATD